MSSPPSTEAALQGGRSPIPPTQILDALPDAAILADCGGGILAWNEAASRLFGWGAAEVVAGRSLVELLPAFARTETGDRIERVAAGAEWSGQVHPRKDDGDGIEAHVRPLRDGSGVVTGLLCVSRPIPSGSGVVRERNDRHAMDILDAMSAHVAVLGPDGLIREVNHAWERFAAENTPGGCAPPSTDVGVDYVALCRACSGAYAEEANPAADGIEDVLRGRRSSFVLEYPCHSPTALRWFAMHVTPLTNGGGAVVAHSDVTARKQAELALEGESRRTELALSAAHMGVWTFEVPRGVIHWSNEARRIVGALELDDTIEAWLGLIHPDDRDFVELRFNEAVSRRMPFSSEFRIARRGGEVQWLAHVAQVECAPSGEVVAVVGTVHDITARKRSEWALTAYNQILELIAAGAELKAILEEAVALVEEQLPGSLCSILILEQTSGRLRSGAGRSLPAEYNRAVDGIAIGPKAGSCGTAAYRKATVTVTDIGSDPLWEDYRELALRHGLRSCVSVPIFSSGNVPGHQKGEVIGTFALYNRAPGDFDRLTYAILTGAEQLVRRAIQSGRHEDAVSVGESAGVIEAAHLAGVAIERDQAGQAVRESEERFRAVFDSAPLAMHVEDLEGRHLFVNQAAAKMYGVAQSAWTGKRARELLPEHLAAVHEQSSRLVLEAGHPVDQRLTLRLPDGREATALATHVLLRSSAGEPYAICGIMKDITELVVVRREFDRLWEHAPDPICVASFDGRFMQVNPAWTRLLGWTEEELLRSSYAELVHPDDHAGLAVVEGRIVRGETIRGYENRYRCRDGTYRWFSWNAIPVPSERVIYGMTRDVTEERRLAEQFRQAQKMEAVGQLASGVAHDFNNLLTVINGYTELLMDEIAAGDPLRDSLAEVRDAGQRATALTSQLLSFSRKAVIEPKILDVNHVVESAARMLRRLLGDNVRLETSLTTIPPVKIDPGQLEQVFMNLAVNARDAMPDGGRLTIGTAAVDLHDGPTTDAGASGPRRYVRIDVRDTGAGMSAEVRSHVFEPFFTTKGPGKGTGLGLATVYGIVQQAGGTIRVESEPGAGTTFQIWLPAMQGQLDGLMPSVLTVAPRGTETVLIAEDADGVRHVACAILELQGYTVLVARTGAEAANVVSEHPGTIDLLLTDVVMPDFGGRALAEIVRNRRPGLRVMYMSGYTDDAVIRSGVESSRDWFIQKPFTPLTLARRVRELLDSPAEQPDRVAT